MRSRELAWWPYAAGAAARDSTHLVHFDTHPTPRTFMTRKVLSLAVTLAACMACSNEANTLTAQHEAAIRDSVTAFLKEHTAFMAAYPAGTQAREKGLRVYDPDVTYGGSVGAPLPMLVQGREQILFGERPSWLGAFDWKPDTVIIKPIAPGAASVTETYREQWSDTAGRSVTIRGIMMMVVRNGPDGWRITHFQASNPAEQETTLFSFARRYLPTPGQ